MLTPISVRITHGKYIKVFEPATCVFTVNFQVLRMSEQTNSSDLYFLNNDQI